MNTANHIGINGLFLRKPGVGIGVVTTFFLSELERIDLKDARYTIYVDNPDMTFSVGERGQVLYLKPWWKRDDIIRKLLWEHIQLPKRAMAEGVTHFLSLYQAPTEFPSRIRHTMVVHDVIPELFPEYIANSRIRFLWNLTKRAITKANNIIAVSQSTKKDITKYLSVPEEKISLAYPSISPIFFQELHSQEIERVLAKYNLAPGYIYHGGGLEIRKNVKSLLTAYAAWRKASSEGNQVPKLVISGLIHSENNSLATDVKGLIAQLGIEEAVELLGFVPNEDLPALYNQAALFVFPSLYEGFGMPVVEALSQGTAVIASRNSSLGEVGGECVLWLGGSETLTKETLEAGYQKALLSSPEMKQVRVLQAKSFCSWQQFAQKVIDTLVQ